MNDETPEHKQPPAEPVDTDQEYIKFINTLKTNIDKALNGNGPKMIGFACFIYPLTPDSENQRATLIHNNEQDKVVSVTAQYVAKQKTRDLKVSRRKDVRRIK